MSLTAEFLRRKDGQLLDVEGDGMLVRGLDAAVRHEPVRLPVAGGFGVATTSVNTRKPSP